MIRLFVNGAGQLQNVVKVDPGDTVVWTSDTHDISVRFAANDNPFTTNAPLNAVRGSKTARAKVKDDVLSPHQFVCDISMERDGAQTNFPNTVGVDTPGA